MAQQIACCTPPVEEPQDPPYDGGVSGDGGSEDPADGGAADANRDQACAGKIGADCLACCEMSGDFVACVTANSCG